MKIIFCMSYLSVPMTAGIIESSESDFLIVAGTESLVKFFKLFYPAEKIFVLKPTPILSRNPLKIIENLYFVYKYKNKTSSTFGKYRDAEVFFFEVAYCEFAAWLMKKLSIANSIFYKPNVSINYLKVDYSLYAILGKWIRKAIYSIDFRPLTAGAGKPYFALTSAFLNGLKARDFHVDANVEALSKKIMESMPEIKNSNILVLCGSIVGNFVEENEYIHHMDTVITYLVKQFGYDKLVVKAHPQSDGYYSKENELKKIPDYFPANLILGNFELIIGYSTTVLIEAANSGKKCISLLNIMKPISQEITESSIKYLNVNSVGHIYYPENLDRFISIIENRKSVGDNYSERL